MFRSACNAVCSLQLPLSLPLSLQLCEIADSQLCAGGEGGLPGGQWQCSGGQAQGEEGGMDLCRGHKLEQRVGHICQNDTGFMLDTRCALAGHPTIFTDVRHYLPWIAEQYGLRWG